MTGTDPLLAELSRFFFAVSFSAAVGRNDFPGLRIHPADQFPSGTGLLFFPVPIGCGLVNIYDAATLVEWNHGNAGSKEKIHFI